MRVAITGGDGQLGRQLVAAFEEAGHEVRRLAHADLEIADAASVEQITKLDAEIVINSAAWTDVDGCARDPDRAMLINAQGARLVAEAAAQTGARIVQISTNEVFDGGATAAYRPGDEPNPINAYGRSKLEGERAVAAANPRHLIVRTAWLFGPGGTNFVTKILGAARRMAEEGQPLRVVSDELGNPTWTPDLAQAIVALVEAPPDAPIVHAVGTPPASRLEWAEVAVRAAELETAIEPIPLASFARASTPPPRAVLAPSPGIDTMDWRPVTERYAAELAAMEAV